MVRFHPLLSCLCQNGVEFVVVGGLAAVAHGSAYLTRDLDVCYSRTKRNREKLAVALRSLHPRLRDAPPDLPFQLDAFLLNTTAILTLTTDAGDLDLLAEVPGLGDFQRVRAASELLEIEGLPCRVLGLAALIAAKKATRRPKDRALLAELEALAAMRQK